MARISDIIAEFINTAIEEDKERKAIIQRNELADKFNCAPSQINYVLTTRFTFEKGYIIESRRGGGGYIVVKKVTYNNEKDRLNIINNSIGERLTYSEGVSIIDNLLKSNLITLSEFEIIKISLNDRTLSSVEDKNKVRAELLKGMITVILS